jgi:hypothetical protein
MPWPLFHRGKARLFEFIAALTDQPVPGSRARAVHSSGGAAGGVVSESQGWPGMARQREPWRFKVLKDGGLSEIM